MLTIFKIKIKNFYFNRTKEKIFPTAAFNKSGPCLSPNVADRPLRPARHYRLGKLLPYQPPKTT